MAWLNLNRQAVAYAATSVGASSMNSVFFFYYVKVYLHMFHVSGFWFQFAQVAYMIWNAVNDPLFGYLQDTSKILCIRRRGLSILYGAPLYSIAFILVWFPWGDPAKGDWLSGLQLLVVLCFYDTLLTFVLLAQCAVFTEMSQKTEDRLRLIKYQQGASLIASTTIFFCESVSHNLDDFRAFQAACCLIGFLAFVAMALSGKYIQTEFDDDVTSEVSKMQSENVNISEQKQSWFKVTMQVVTQRNFIVFVLMNFGQIYHNTFHSNFTRIICDSLVTKEILSPAWKTTFYGALPMIHRLMLIFGMPLLSRVGHYRVIRWSFIVKIVAGISLFCLGATPWAVMAFYIIDSTFSHATFHLFNLPVSEIIDEDKEKYNRRLPISSMIYGTNALITKPATSLAPMFTVAVLNNYGYEELRQSGASANPGPDLLYVMFYLTCLTPVIIGAFQLFAWSFYRTPVISTKHTVN